MAWREHASCCARCGGLGRGSGTGIKPVRVVASANFLVCDRVRRLVNAPQPGEPAGTQCMSHHQRHPRNLHIPCVRVCMCKYAATRARASRCWWPPWPRAVPSRWAPWAMTPRWPRCRAARACPSSTSSSSSRRWAGAGRWAVGVWWGLGRAQRSDHPDEPAWDPLTSRMLAHACAPTMPMQGGRLPACAPTIIQQQHPSRSYS